MEFQNHTLPSPRSSQMLFHDEYTVSGLLQGIQAVSSCNNTAQVAPPQRHTVWHHVRLHCSHHVGMYYVASHIPNLRAPPAGNIPGKGLLHQVIILQPNWKDIPVFCWLRNQHRSFPGCVEKAMSISIRIAGPEIHAAGNIWYSHLSM